MAYSAALMNKAEEMFATVKAPYPAERTQLVCGILDACLESKIRQHQRLDTAELNVKYRPSATSQFAGAEGQNT